MQEEAIFVCDKISPIIPRLPDFRHVPMAIREQWDEFKAYLKMFVYHKLAHVIVLKDANTNLVASLGCFGLLMASLRE